MFVVANLVFALAHIIQGLMYALFMLLLVRMVISFLPPQQLFRYRRFITTIIRITDWFLKPLRRRLPLVHGGFDLSPLLVLLVMYFIELVVVKSLFQLAVRLSVQ